MRALVGRRGRPPGRGVAVVAVGRAAVLRQLGFGRAGAGTHVDRPLLAAAEDVEVHGVAGMDLGHLAGQLRGRLSPAGR